jgi:5-methylcytosine-specific restriction endonuclease McrA
MSPFWQLVFFCTTLSWLLIVIANLVRRHFVGYKTWYHTTYLASWHWLFVRLLVKLTRLNQCQRLGRHEGYLDVHHKKWAYRWMWWEFLPHVLFFGLELLCRKHHNDRTEMDKTK